GRLLGLNDLVVTPEELFVKADDRQCDFILPVEIDVGYDGRVLAAIGPLQKTNHGRVEQVSHGSPSPRSNAANSSSRRRRTCSMTRSTPARFGSDASVATIPFFFCGPGRCLTCSSNAATAPSRIATRFSSVFGDMVYLPNLTLSLYPIPRPAT